VIKLSESIAAKVSAGKEFCIFCESPILAGQKVLAGEHRMGGRVIGKTVHVESCLDCAGELNVFLQVQIDKARSL